MIITFVQFAADFEVFAPDAFTVGNMVAFTMNDLGDTCQARLMKADVSEDGRSVEITIEVGRSSFPHARISHRR